MLSVIVVSLGSSVVYKMCGDITIGSLIKHWITDTKQNLHPGRVELHTTEGTTLEDDDVVESIPLGEIGTRIVRAESKDILRVFYKCKDTGERKEMAIPIFFTCTGRQLREQIAKLIDVKLGGFRLSYRKESVDSWSKLREKDTLISQGLTPHFQMELEQAQSGIVQCSTRSRTWTKEISFFPDQPIDVLLEQRIDLTDQRMFKDGNIVELRRGLTIKEAGICPTDGPLELSLVIREAVVVETQWKECIMKFWPEEKLNIIFNRLEELGKSTNIEEEEEEEEPNPMLEYDPILFNDLLYPDERQEDYTRSYPKKRNRKKQPQRILERVIYYRGFPLNLDATFGELRLPAYALLSVDPMKLRIDKPLEYHFIARVPHNASVGDLYQLLPILKPVLHVETFNICLFRTVLKPNTAALSRFRIVDGSQIALQHVVCRR